MTAHPTAKFVQRCWGEVSVLFLCCMAGCSGSGRIELASLNYRVIDPPAGPAPRVVKIDIDRCYWWTDEGGRVWIAMQREQTPLLNPRLRFLFQLSFALEELPAGRALDYRIGAQEMRATVRLGPWESRFTSRVGILALYRESHDRLRGSVRLQASRFSARVLGGWGKPTRYLLLGSFLAVRDEQRGRPIAEATESGGWGRHIRDQGAAPKEVDQRTSTSPTTPTTAPARR